MIAYTVICTFKNEALAQEWLAWLRDEHLADVIEAGALDAEIVKMDGTPVRCEVRYHFESREAFNRYEREHAARLRGEGLKKFPLDRGLSYVRSVGEVAGRSRPAASEPKASANAAIVELKEGAETGTAPAGRSRGTKSAGGRRKKTRRKKTASTEKA